MPPSTFSIRDLYTAVTISDERLLPVRRLRTEAIREYGSRFWYNDDRKSRALNLVQRGISILVAHLAGRNPAFECDTERLQFRGNARKMSKQLEMRAKKAGMVTWARMCLKDAFFGGKCVVRIGERSTAEVVRNGDRFVHRGEVYRRRVPFDDWIFDPSAREDAEAFFEGERYRIGKNKALAAVDQGIFGFDWGAMDPGDTETMEMLSALSEAGIDINELASPDEAKALLTNAPSITDGRSHTREDRAEQVTQGATTAQQRNALIDTIELIDLAIYVDAETCILLTMISDEGPGNKYLRAEIWDGPSKGPYEHLEFDPIPDNPHGPSVSGHMREQAEIANTVIGKMVRQIERTKRVLAYQKKRSQDALKVSKAADGETVGIDGDPKEMETYDLGGVSPDLAPFASMIVSFWNQQGSFDILGGQAGGPSRTATEDSRLGVSASILIEQMGDLFDDFMNRVAQHEAWYFWSDPFIVAPMTMRLPGAFSVEVVYDAQARLGEFEDYTFKIRPRSMQRIDPNVKSQRVVQLVQAVMVAAEVEANTGRIDAAGVARVLGHEFEIDELDEILRDPMVQMQEMDLYSGVPMPQQGIPGKQYPGLAMADTRGGAGGTSKAAQLSSVFQSARAPMRGAKGI